MEGLNTGMLDPSHASASSLPHTPNINRAGMPLHPPAPSTTPTYAGTYNVPQGHEKPKCKCGEEAKLLASNSDDNPGRMYWKCRDRRCNTFLWEDLLICTTCIKKGHSAFCCKRQ
ncbi:TPA: DNA topoisomerase 3-alpha [Trebouxia sp. C0005]